MVIYDSPAFSDICPLHVPWIHSSSSTFYVICHLHLNCSRFYSAFSFLSPYSVKKLCQPF